MCVCVRMWVGGCGLGSECSWRAGQQLFANALGSTGHKVEEEAQGQKRRMGQDVVKTRVWMVEGHFMSSGRFPKSIFVEEKFSFSYHE